MNCFTELRSGHGCILRYYHASTEHASYIAYIAIASGHLLLSARLGICACITADFMLLERFITALL